MDDDVATSITGRIDSCNSMLELIVGLELLGGDDFAGIHSFEKPRRG